MKLCRLSLQKFGAGFGFFLFSDVNFYKTK